MRHLTLNQWVWCTSLLARIPLAVGWQMPPTTTCHSLGRSLDHLGGPGRQALDLKWKMGEEHKQLVSSENSPSLRLPVKPEHHRMGGADVTKLGLEQLARQWQELCTWMKYSQTGKIILTKCFSENMRLRETLLISTVGPVHFRDLYGLGWTGLYHRKEIECSYDFPPAMESLALVPNKH